MNKRPSALFNWIATLSACVRDWYERRCFGSKGHSALLSVTYFRCTAPLLCAVELFVFCSYWGNLGHFHRYYTNTMRQNTKYHRKHSKAVMWVYYIWSGPTLVFICSLQLDNVLFLLWFILLQTRLLTLPLLWPAWSSTSLCRWSQSLSRVSPQTKMSKMPAWLKRSAGNLTHWVIRVEGRCLHSIIEECFKDAYRRLLPEVFLVSASHSVMSRDRDALHPPLWEVLSTKRLHKKTCKC